MGGKGYFLRFVYADSSWYHLQCEDFSFSFCRNGELETASQKEI